MFAWFAQAWNVSTSWAPPKNDIQIGFYEHVPYVATNLSVDVQSGSLTGLGTGVACVIFDGRAYIYDPSDISSPHDGLAVIVDGTAPGRRYKVAPRLIYGAAGTAAAPAIAAGGDLDTGLFGPAANVLAVATGGAERIRVNGSGNVGLGTTSPACRFHVSGTGEVIRAVATASSAILSINQSQDPAVSSDRPVIQLQKNSSPVLNIFAESSVAGLGIIYYEAIGAAASHVFFGGPLRSGVDNTHSLGVAGARWSVVFAGTGTINTSDATQKQVRGDIADVELDAWGDVRPLIFRWKDAYERKGDDARLHAGLIAQDVEAAFAAHGLDAARYGLWCKDAVTKKVKRTEIQRRPKMRKVTEQVTEIEIRGGVPTQIKRAVEREEFVTDMVAVVNAAGVPVMQDGEPVMHPVPVMEDVTVEVEADEPDGFRLGLRYDQCAIFEAAWARRELARLQARIAALETA